MDIKITIKTNYPDGTNNYPKGGKKIGEVSLEDVFSFKTLDKLMESLNDCYNGCYDCIPIKFEVEMELDGDV